MNLEFDKVVANFDSAIEAMFQKKETKADKLREDATKYVEDNIFLDKTNEKMEEALLASTAQELTDIYNSLLDIPGRFDAAKNIIYKNYWFDDEVEDRIEYLEEGD